MKKLLKKLLPRRSKQGVTLVESVIAVVVLGMFATGVLSLLTTGGAKIMEISGESAAYAEATQKLDLVISAISNGSDEAAGYIVVDNATGEVRLDIQNLKRALDLDDVTIVPVTSLYDNSAGATESNVRGWYLTLTYGGETVTGFAGNNEGVFDK